MLVCQLDVAGQSGFSENSYYMQQYQIVAQPVSEAERKYDYYGNYIGIYQLWQRAEWHSQSGGEYIYVWSYGQWQTQWYNGNYYWYSWVNYQRFMGY